MAEFNFDAGYEEFYPDTIFLESDIGLHVCCIEDGQRQITMTPHNFTLAISLQEHNGCSGNGSESSIATPAHNMSGTSIATSVTQRKVYASYYLIYAWDKLVLWHS